MHHASCIMHHASCIMHHAVSSLINPYYMRVLKICLLHCLRSAHIATFPLGPLQAKEIICPYQSTDVHFRKRQPKHYNRS